VAGDRASFVDAVADTPVSAGDGDQAVDGATAATDSALDGVRAAADAPDTMQAEAGIARPAKIVGGGCSCEVAAAGRTRHGGWTVLALALAALVRRFSRREANKGGAK